MWSWRTAAPPPGFRSIGTVYGVGWALRRFGSNFRRENPPDPCEPASHALPFPGLRKL
jgi:hypothetical protein